MYNKTTIILTEREEVAFALNNMLHYLRLPPPTIVTAHTGNFLFTQHVPDLVIFDLPVFQVIQKAPDSWKETRWIFIASNEKEAVEALHAGVHDYVLHNDDPEKLPQVVSDVLFLNKVSNIKNILQHLQPKESAATYIPGKSIDLTGKEIEILKLLRQGIPLKEIAVHTQNSYETIRTHIKKIYKKLGVNSSAEAIIKAIDLKF